MKGKKKTNTEIAIESYIKPEVLKAFGIEKTHLTPTVKVSISLNVPPEKVDIVSKQLLGVAVNNDVYHDGIIKQGNIEFTEN